MTERLSALTAGLVEAMREDDDLVFAAEDALERLRCEWEEESARYRAERRRVEIRHYILRPLRAASSETGGETK